ncbi:RNA-binding protein 41 isoform X2 [Scophthalmus maximus]|uniref:RNA-binding protein 41 isoform X2 n=1 Tax=Scophthalmus maximus TaxID=52904 RepID=UPI0015E0B948|nr:RNA-binding protein 41 isoform X2 [Scophthalmus maximus]
MIPHAGTGSTRRKHATSEPAVLRGGSAAGGAGDGGPAAAAQPPAAAAPHGRRHRAVRNHPLVSPGDVNHEKYDVMICVAKRQCFAPSALYRPFGEQAAGVRSLSQFQALQDRERELASLRELGLTEAEIKLWRSRDAPEAEEKSHGVCAAPGARQQRLRVITDKIDAREELLSRPQRFASSQPLSRREMEIERALFQGTDRLGFLAALYHRDEDNQDGQQGVAPSDPMDTLYRDVLGEERPRASPRDSGEEPNAASQMSRHRTVSDQSRTRQKDDGQSSSFCVSSPSVTWTLGEVMKEHRSDRSSADTSDQQHRQEEQRRPTAPAKVEINQPIGSLCGAGKAGSAGPLTLRGEIKTITDEEILQNRESEEGIRSIARFRNYQPGKPSKVLCVKNLSAQASVAQLVALFSRFEPEDGPPVVYRLLTGRMKGQAFVTLPDADAAQNALLLIHGYRLLGKPLVVEFGREKEKEEQQEKK